MSKTVGFCILDSDTRAADSLAAIVEREEPGVRVVITASIPQAMVCLQRQPSEYLLTRITMWDDWRIMAGLLSTPPVRVGFLSGAGEKCTQHLAEEVDFYLRPPWVASRVRQVIRRMMNDEFQPRTLEFLFLREDCRYYAVPFASLKAIERKGSLLYVWTDRREFVVNGSMSDLERRLPVHFTRVSRNMLVANQKGL